jgi:hypothetical protein
VAGEELDQFVEDAGWERGVGYRGSATLLRFALL